MEFEQKDFPGLTDEILFNRYKDGDVQAFNEILKRNKGLIYSLILRYVSIHSVADEIFQDIFLKVCKNRDLFRESVSFKSWLVTICKNTCIDHLRKKNRTLKTETLDGHTDVDRRQLSEKIASEEQSPHETLVIQMENEDLAGLIDQLPLEQKETFYLKVVMEFTFEEIGQSMGCSANTAKSRYRYALTALKSLVKRKRVLKQIS